jgi:ketosteroid isomerase-like protein
MSQENIEFLKRAYAATNEGDRSLFTAHYDPDVELYVSDSAVEPGIYRGAGAVSAYRSAIIEAWDTAQLEAREFVDLRDRVLVVVDARAWNRQSNISLDHELAYVWYFSGDKIVRIEYYFDGKQEAFEALGLSA